MAEAYDKGKHYEEHVAKLVRRKLDKGAMRNKGSHTGGSRRADIFTNLPIHIEAKHHENIRLKEWMAQAEAATSFSHKPVVAFRIEESDYVCMNLNDMLDLFVEIADLTAEVADLRAPITKNLPTVAEVIRVQKDIDLQQKIQPAVDRIVEQKVKQRKTYSCRAGHLSDEYGYCMQKGCKFTRTYKPPKAKR